MKTSCQRKQIIVTSVVALLLILVSIYFLDVRLALYIKHAVHSFPYLNKSFNYIPNLLPLAVLVGTASMWVLFIWIHYRGSAYHANFLKLAATAVPSAYLLKMLLQYVFGRTNIKAWLSSGKPLQFSWFTPLSQSPCFPSGHMTVFTAFFVVVWHYYPRYRPFAAIALLTLASALILTNYHFLSDIIAGFVCGIFVATAVGRIMPPAPVEIDNS